MPIPDFQTVMRPILTSLAAESPMSASQLRSRLAQQLEVSAEEQQEMLPSGNQTTWANRVGWALTHLSQAGLVERPARGHYALTERGRGILETNPNRVDVGVLNAFAEYRDFRARKKIAPSPDVPAVDFGEVSPREAIGALVLQSETSLAADLLDAVLSRPPEFLETLALSLLSAMGYGGRELLLEHTGRAGDAGLDGIVRQDALGMDLIGVQAKRYDPDNPVQRPALQAFVGALQGAQTSRGVFITTGRFTSGAADFARSVAMQLVLIDGSELTRLMVKYNVGVQAQETFRLKALDQEFFD